MSKIVHILREIRNENRQCAACPHRGECNAPVPLAGNLASCIVIVGRDPGEQEDLYGFPFIGMSGDILEKACLQAGFSMWAECVITNAMKCRPKDNIAPPLDQYRTCAEKWLYPELNAINPKFVILLGKESLQTVLPGINLSSGETIQINDATYAHLYHPSFWLKRGRMKYAKAHIIPFLKEWYRIWQEKGILVRQVSEYIERRPEPSFH